MKININMPANAIYMLHTAPEVKGSKCVLVHFDRYGVPRSLMSGSFGDSVFKEIPDTTWHTADFHGHMVASHEPDYKSIPRRRIKQIVKHWKRNADICIKARDAKDFTPIMAWYGGFVPSPQNK